MRKILSKVSFLMCDSDNDNDSDVDVILCDSLCVYVIVCFDSG